MGQMKAYRLVVTVAKSDEAAILDRYDVRPYDIDTSTFTRLSPVVASFRKLDSAMEYVDRVSPVLENRTGPRALAHKIDKLIARTRKRYDDKAFAWKEARRIRLLMREHERATRPRPPA